MDIVAAREIMESPAVKDFRRHLEAAGVEAWRSAKTPEEREYAFFSDKAFRELFQLLSMVSETPLSNESVRDGRLPYIGGLTK